MHRKRINLCLFDSKFLFTPIHIIVGSQHYCQSIKINQTAHKIIQIKPVVVTVSLYQTKAINRVEIVDITPKIIVHLHNPIPFFIDHNQNIVPIIYAINAARYQYQELVNSNCFEPISAMTSNNNNHTIKGIRDINFYIIL